MAPPSENPRALVLVHLDHEGVGALGEWLPAGGLELDEVRLHEGDPVPAELGPGHRALIVMGGGMGVGDADTHPWIRDELALIRRTTEAGTPVLGVCLGAQLLAAANGGRVEVGAGGPEVGAGVVHLTQHAAADPLFGGVPPDAEVVQWHWDAVVELPPGSTLLATGQRYPHQAFRVGERAWGVQFHVETYASMVERWAAIDAAKLAGDGIDAMSAARGAGALTSSLERTWRPVVERFATMATR